MGGRGAEYINHCCDPNLSAWIFRGHILYMSKRDIEPGEELTVDYKFAKKAPKTPCHCGAARAGGPCN